MDRKRVNEVKESIRQCLRDNLLTEREVKEILHEVSPYYQMSRSLEEFIRDIVREEIKKATSEIQRGADNINLPMINAVSRDVISDGRVISEIQHGAGGAIFEVNYD